MTYSSLARPAWLLVAAAALGACSGGSSSTSSAPAPASAPASAPAASPAATRAGAGGMPAGVTAAMVAEGDSLFHARSCRNCHGPDAKGRTNGPDLTSGKFLHVNGSYDDFVRIITDRRPGRADQGSRRTRSRCVRAAAVSPRCSPTTRSKRSPRTSTH